MTSAIPASREHRQKAFRSQSSTAILPPTARRSVFLRSGTCRISCGRNYDASILDPRIRNVGEAIGVAAKLNMSAGDPAHAPFSSTVAVDMIGQVEKRLQGELPFVEPIGFKGLLAPDWKEAAEIFPGDPKWALDPKKIVLGRTLYLKLCVECHAGPVRDPRYPHRRAHVRSGWTRTG